MNKKYLIGIYDAIVVMVIAIIAIIVAYILMKEDAITIILFQGLLIWLLTTLSQFYKELKEYRKDDKSNKKDDELKNDNHKENHNTKNCCIKNQESLKLNLYNHNFRLFHYYNPFSILK